jgi:hypothetical protein
VESLNQLTLVVPTYNRREAVVSNSKKLIESGVLSRVNYLVIDNNSGDGTYDELFSLFNDIGNASVKKNDENLGFFGNFIKCFEEASTDYILISSDEDEVITENISKYIDYLNEFKPDFSSSIVLRCMGNRSIIHKGRKSKKNISVDDLRLSSFYASGLGFNRKEAGKYLDVIRENKRNEMVFLYPMFALCSVLLAKGCKCLWFDRPLHKMQYILPTEIETSLGTKHFHLESRVAQMRGYKKFIENLEVSASSDSEKCIFRSLIFRHYSDFFSLIRHAIRQESDKDFIRAYDQSAELFLLSHLLRRPFLTIKNIVIIIFKKIVRYL